MRVGWRACTLLQVVSKKEKESKVASNENCLVLALCIVIPSNFMSKKSEKHNAGRTL